MTDAQILHRYRESNALSIRKLSERIGVEPRRVRRVLSGAGDLPVQVRAYLEKVVGK